MITNKRGIQTLDQIFPVFYESAGPQLIELLTSSTKLEIDGVIDQAREKVRRDDKRRENLYLTGAYGRLAMLEWSPEYNNAANLEDEIGELKSLIGQ